MMANVRRFILPSEIYAPLEQMLGEFFEAQSARIEWLELHLGKLLSAINKDPIIYLNHGASQPTLVDPNLKLALHELKRHAGVATTIASTSQLKEIFLYAESGALIYFNSFDVRNIPMHLCICYRANTNLGVALSASRHLISRFVNSPV